MFGLECEDLIVGLLRDSLSLIGCPIEVLGLLIGNLDILSIDLVNSNLVPHLLPHDIDLLSEGLILRLEIVILDQMLVKLILHGLDRVCILDHLGRWRPHNLQLRLLLRQLVASLLVLVLQDHQAPKLKRLAIINSKLKI
jgi:hypothetical protein